MGVPIEPGSGEVGREDLAHSSDGGQPAKSRTVRVLRTFAIAVPAVLFVGLFAYGVFTSAPAAEPGGPAPDFDLEIFAGEDALTAAILKDGRLSSDELRGRPVVVNFWASWCVPCREEAPLLESAWKKYQKLGVVFVGINVQDARSEALAFIDEFDITYPQVNAPGFDVSNDFDVTGVPETFFIGHDWRFVGMASGVAEGQQGGFKILGAISEEQLLHNVELLIRRAEGPRTRGG